jgi:hypothetical protein
MYLTERQGTEAVKTASMQKTAEEIRMEKLGSAARAEFNAQLDSYLTQFAFEDLSR